MIIREGDVPDSIEAVAQGVTYQLRPDELLLDIPDGTRMHVKEGREIVYSRGPDAGDRDIILFLLGTAWGALCYQRGLIPIHASAVLAGGKIAAFTGYSGAGKSTMAANLALRGYPFFTDDTLIFDPSAKGDGAICFAGQKQLKLWGDAIDKTGAEALDPVREANAIDKFYAVPPGQSEIAVAPLTRLFLLKRALGDATELNTLTELPPAEALQAIRRNLYRPHFAEVLLGRKPLFLALKKLLENVKVSEFVRQLGPENYETAIDYVSEAIGPATSQDS
ncbi:hypothetical protein [Erythrobacter sp. THAF29]|uniref:hypothetical protein n=1 Tax=Erythrobacter sp. THAF29 TaxID=2587851 RepID=UPI00126937EE|nr:hypothetical protein [Erythrobacter sp. THAF29]